MLFGSEVHTLCKTFMILEQKQPLFQKYNSRLEKKVERSLKKVLLAHLSEGRAKSRDLLL